MQFVNICYNPYMNFQKLCNYFFELGALKKFRHSGTMLAGVKEPDTIAEHVYRTSLIGYVLAKMEKADTAKTALICLLHDNAETRITDLHRVARRYIDPRKAEKKAYEDQVFGLPEEIKKMFTRAFLDYENAKSKEAVIARDADMLETAFQAKEYLDCGYKACQDWIDNVEKCLKTKSAKKILEQMRKTAFTDWWRELKMTNY